MKRFLFGLAVFSMGVLAAVIYGHTHSKGILLAGFVLMLTGAYMFSSEEETVSDKFSCKRKGGKRFGKIPSATPRIKA